MNVNILISQKQLAVFTGVDNIDTEYFTSAAYIAQNRHLKSILGTKLYKEMDEVIFKAEDQELADMIIVYLCYKTAEILSKTATMKLANAGATINGNSGISNLTNSTEAMFVSANFWKDEADRIAKDMQVYIKNNIDLYREYLSDKYVKTQLYSAATSGLWLGGIRHMDVR